MSKKLIVLSLLAGFTGAVLADNVPAGNASNSMTPAATAPAPKKSSTAHKKKTSHKAKTAPVATPAAPATDANAPK